MSEFSVQPQAEHEVREALAKYKFALIHCHYRNWWHRFSLWNRAVDAMTAERALVTAEGDAKRICNQSEDHKRWGRLLSSSQSAEVRAKDKFVDLIHSR